MHYAIRVTIAAALVGGLVGCADFAESSRQVVRSVDDANTTNAVLNAFAADPAKIAFTDIDVNSEAGVVRLTGTVVNAPSEQHAISVASNVRGVRQVVSELRIVEEAANTGNTPRGSDAQITAAVQHRLANDRDHAALAHVNVTTDNGTVRLTGVVADATSQQRARELARDVTDVRRVIDDLQVRESRADQAVTTANLDATITAGVKRALSNGRNYAGVGVRTTGGTVYLSGLVNNIATKDRAGQLAFDVDGVRRVVNNLQTGTDRSSR